MTAATTHRSLLQPLRDEHHELLPHIETLRTTADLVGASSDAELLERIDEAGHFLSHHLIPHAAAEDEALYPVVEEAMSAPGATDSMRRDHVEVGRLTEELSVLRVEIGRGAISEQAARDLRRVLYGLYAVVKLHFAKEEEIYLPVLERWLTPERAIRLFEDLGAAASAAHGRADQI